MEKENKPLAKKEISFTKESKWDVSDPENPEPIEWTGYAGFFSDDVKQAVKEALEEIHYNVCEKEVFISFSETAFDRDIKEVFKNKFGFEEETITN